MKKKKMLIKKSHFKIFIEHGVHIWVALFFANIILLYSFYFYFHGLICTPEPQKIVNPLQNYFSVICTIKQQDSLFSVLINPNSSAKAAENPLPSDSPELPVEAPSPEISLPEDIVMPTPAGASINLSFTYPGIGSGGGNMKPLHKIRDARVLIYAPDVNSLLRISKPVYSVNGILYYDDNPLSPTYSSFINPAFDLGPAVPDDTFQIVVKADKALSKLIKDKSSDIGGKLFNIAKFSRQKMGQQTLIVGDIAPPGSEDNIMDIKDYNLVVDCFGSKANTTGCPDPNAADLNDDGVIDGLDYNLLLLSFKTLLQQGYPVPTYVMKQIPLNIVPSPTKEPVPTKTPTPSVMKAAVKTSTGSSAGGIFFLLFLIILGICGFVMYKINPKFNELVHKLLPVNKSKKTANPEAKTDSQTTAVPTVENTQPQETVIADATQLSQAAAQSTDQPPVSQQPASTPASNEGVVEGDYFIKQKSKDEQKGGFWLSLTGDNGLIEGFYTGKEVTDGFAKVKGVMKTEGDKTYLLVSEITPDV